MPQPGQSFTDLIGNNGFRSINIRLSEHVPYQIPPLAVLVLVGHIKTCPRARRKAIISPRLRKFATREVDLLNAGDFGE